MGLISYVYKNLIGMKMVAEKTGDNTELKYYIFSTKDEIIRKIVINYLNGRNGYVMDKNEYEKLEKNYLVEKITGTVTRVFIKCYERGEKLAE